MVPADVYQSAKEIGPKGRTFEATMNNSLMARRVLGGNHLRRNCDRKRSGGGNGKQGKGRDDLALQWKANGGNGQGGGHG